MSNNIYDLNNIYTTNFSDTQIISGKHTKFLRIKNKNVSVPLFVSILPQIIGVDNNNINEYRDNLFINGVDVCDMIELLYSSLNINSRFTNESDKLFPLNKFNINNPEYTTYNNFKYDNSKFFKWPRDSRIFQNGYTVINSSKVNPGNELSVRIDYNGKKDMYIKLNYLITEKIFHYDNINDFFPRIFTDISIPGITIKKGDIHLSNGVYKVNKGIDVWVDLDNPNLGIKELHKHKLYNELSTARGVSFIDFKEVDLLLHKTELRKTSRDSKYFIDKPILDKQINDDKDSFMLMRTNPKLTGNIKLVVDSNENLYLESISANNELSNSKYKKNRINPTSDYASDIYNTFRTLPKSSLYHLYQKDDKYTNTKRNFSEQYDFFYGYGASQLNSKYYDEHISLFAPIFIKSKLPEFFVIFKVNGPVNKETYINVNNKDIISNIFNDAKILKTFDMRETSPIGVYLRNIISDVNFKESPINTSYENGDLTSFNGISYKDGIITDKVEMLHDFYTEDKPINIFDEYITQGFERNSIISSNIINFEFLFNDDESELFEINRYFGLYCNEIELAKFEIYPEGFDNIKNQKPIPRKGIDTEPYSLNPFIQENENGIVIPIDYLQENINNKQSGLIDGKIPLPAHIKDHNRVFFIKDRFNNFDRIKNIIEIDNKYTGINVYDNKVDFSKYAGISNMTSQLQCELLDIGKSQLVININDHFKDSNIIMSGEEFEIEWKGVNNTDFRWKIIANKTGVNSGDAWNYPVYDQNKKLYINSFSNEGSTEDIAKAMANCFNSFDNKIFDAVNIGNDVIIVLKNPGEYGNNVIFHRNLKINSVPNNVSYYSINPIIKNEYVTKNIGETATTGIFKLKEIINSNRINKYKLKITYVSEDKSYIHVSIEKNYKFYYNIIFNLNNIKEYNDGVISIEPILYNDNNTSLNYNIDDEFIFNIEDNKISQNFVGGNKINRNRARVYKNEAEFINNKEWFQSHKEKYSRLKTWNIQGNELINLYYVDDPVIEFGKVVNYKNVSNYNTIQMANEYEFYISNTKRIIAFDCFNPSISLMSFLNVKDFDFDWNNSDYSYTPNIELDKYFNITKLKKDEILELNNNENFKILSGSVRIEGYENGEWVHLIIKDKLFNTFIPFYEREIEKTIFVKRNITKYRAIASSDSELKNINYINDHDINNFIGFNGIEDFNTSEDDIKLNEMIRDNNIERFSYNKLNSEYDRLRENFIKDYAVKSKVVPYINKWVNIGTDCRDNKYRLNNSDAFGITNFSPDSEILEQSANLFTHEFLYIDKIPKGIDSKFIKHTKSYFNEGITDKVNNIDGINYSWYELFKDNKSDWFSKYFTIGYPTELDYDGNKIEKSKDERYIFIEKIPGVDNSQGLFRGGKFEIIANNNINKYNNYKFSGILRILPIDNNLNDSIEFISNDIYKTVVMIVTMYINDYRINNNYYDYSFLYFGKSVIHNTNTYKPIYKYDDTNGEIIDITNDDYIFNGINGITQFNYGDIKLTNNNINNIKYVSDYDTNINYNNGNYSEISGYNHNDNITNFTYKNNNIYKYNIDLNNSWPIKSTETQSKNINNQTNLWYLDGGNNYLKERLEDISFANIFKRVNNNDNILYYTVNENGISDGDFTIKFIESDRIKISNKLIPVLDSDKPALYTTTDIIGFDLEKTNNESVIFRHRGRYAPKTRNIFNYWLREDKSMTDYYNIDFLLSNTRLFTEYDYFGDIDNLYYNKIAEHEILNISNNSEYYSLYPYINDVAIDYKQIFTFNSNWDNNYYQLNENLKKIKNIEGTEELLESKSFFGSKIMITPNNLDIHKFKDSEIQYKYKTQNQATDVNILGKNQKNKIDITLDIEKILIRILKESGINKEFIKLKNAGITRFSNMNEDNLNNEIEKYIKLNILKLYRVNNISLYKNNYTAKNKNDIFLYNLTEAEKLNLGYRITKDTKVNKKGDYIYTIEEELDDTNHSSYSISINITRI